MNIKLIYLDTEKVYKTLIKLRLKMNQGIIEYIGPSQSTGHILNWQFLDELQSFSIHLQHIQYGNFFCKLCFECIIVTEYIKISMYLLN